MTKKNTAVDDNKGFDLPKKKKTDNAAQTSTVQASIVDVTSDSYSVIRQGTSTNTFTKTRDTNKNTAIDSITGEATITNGDLILKIPNYAQLTGLKTSTHQLLDIITISLTESGAKSPTVHLTLDNYMQRRGLKDRKEARKQLTADLDVLLKTSLTWEEKRGKSTIPYAGVNITDSWSWTDSKKHTIAYTFGQTFYNVLLSYPVMSYPAQLQTFNNRRNPNSYYFLRKITEHKNMNVGKKNEDIIAVKTLLEASPFIPSYKEVMEGNRNLTDRIINPFERDMDNLAPTLNWEYCHSLGGPLKDKELETMSYELFETLLIKTTWGAYPDQTARLERKAERQEEKAANKKKK